VVAAALHMRLFDVDAVEPKRSDVDMGILMVDELSYYCGFARPYRRSKQQIPRMPYEQPAS
jgi:hypothetical protein